MIKLVSTRLAVGVGVLALSLTAGAGIASADPDLGPMVNTTCSYPQVIAALTAQDASAAKMFTSSPAADSGLKQFLAAPKDERQRMAEMMASHPSNQPYLGLMQQVFNTCGNF